jgi:hypothetical protein
MPTADDIAARKSDQESEGRNRQHPADDQGNRAPDPRTDRLNDNAEPPLEDQPRGSDDETGQPREREPAKPVYMSPSDKARAEIAKRFKRDEEPPVEFNGDANDPAMLYGRNGQKPQAEPDPEPQADPEPQPEPQAEEPLHTIKVRGKELKLTTAQLLERAAKVEAADTYLAESRDLLEQAKQIRQGNRERDPADPHRPEDRNNTQDDLSDPNGQGDPQHPEDELEGAIEEIRYGTDSKEARAKLDKAIAKRVTNVLTQTQIDQLRQADTTKSVRAINAFKEANPELAKDPIAEQVIANQIFAIQREELKQLGVDESKIPQDNSQLARMHQHWRLQGQPVSNQEQMLDKAKGRFVEWKGGSKPQPQPTAQPRRDQPRVEVNVDRNARRANLPNQPTRSSTPPPAPSRQNDSGQPRSRSDVIMNMRKGRGQHVA